MKLHMFDVEKNEYVLSIHIRWMKLLAKISKKFRSVCETFTTFSEHVPMGLCFKSDGQYYIFMNDTGKVNDYVFKHEIAHIKLGHVGRDEKPGYKAAKQQELDADKYAFEVLKCKPLLMWRTLGLYCEELQDKFLRSGHNDVECYATYRATMARMKQLEELMGVEETEML